MLDRLLRRLSRRLRPVRAPVPARVDVPAGDAFELELDPERPVPVTTDAAGGTQARAPSARAPWPGMGLRLSPGEGLRTPTLAVGPESVLRLAIEGAPDASGEWELAWSDDGAGWRLLAHGPLLADPPGVSIELALAALAGRSLCFRLRRAGQGQGDAFVTRLQVAPRHLAGRTHALASYAFRLRNEVANFSGDAYRHAMYGDEPAAGVAPGAVRAATADEGDSGFADAMRARIDARLAALQPQPGEVAFNFALRALERLLPTEAPNFFRRARERGRDRPLRLLSILSGAARVEEQLLSYCPMGAELTLIDASPDLIGRAAARMAASHPTVKVDCLVGDINRGLPGQGRYDVILCVSALHHVADLERVLSEVNARLEDDGEFWSIGEQIGRNGNRLWPEALAAANAAFAALPPHLRRNAHTGEVDAQVSDRDFSIGCFEGVRSEELERLLEAYLVPVDVFRRNAFLWRLTDATYGDNYRMDDPGDVAHLKDLVAAEALHWVLGGRATELHGVYRKKVVPAPAGAGDGLRSAS